MPNGKRVEKFRENAKFTEQDVSKHLKTVTDVKVLQADGLIPDCYIESRTISGFLCKLFCHNTMCKKGSCFTG